MPLYLIDVEVEKGAGPMDLSIRDCLSLIN